MATQPFFFTTETCSPQWCHSNPDVGRQRFRRSSAHLQNSQRAALILPKLCDWATKCKPKACSMSGGGMTCPLRFHSRFPWRWCRKEKGGVSRLGMPRRGAGPYRTEVRKYGGPDIRNLWSQNGYDVHIKYFNTILKNNLDVLVNKWSAPWWETGIINVLYIVFLDKMHLIFHQTLQEWFSYYLFVFLATNEHLNLFN